MINKTLLLPLLLSLLIGVYLFPIGRQIQSSETSRSASLQGAAALAHLKANGDYDALNEALRKARYRINSLPRQPLSQLAGAPIGEFAAQNAAQSLQTYFTEDGSVHLLPAQKAAWQLGLKLRGIGTQECPLPVATTKTSAQNNRVEIYKHFGNQQPAELIEWYVNTSAGLEQGFTLNQRPAMNRQAPLRLIFALTGDLHPKLAANEQSVTMVSNNGSAVLQYDKLGELSI